MLNNERRLAALEATAAKGAASLNVVQIFPKPGQTTEQATREAGHDPGEQDTMFICFVGLESDGGGE